jgi:hypothetical protein
MCEKHRKLPRKQQLLYLVEWKKTHKPRHNGAENGVHQRAKSLSDLVHDAVESGMDVEVVINRARV